MYLRVSEYLAICILHLLHSHILLCLSIQVLSIIFLYLINFDCALPFICHLFYIHYNISHHHTI